MVRRFMIRFYGHRLARAHVCVCECSFRIFAHFELFSHFVRIFIQIVLRFTMFMIITDRAKDVVGSSQILRRQFLVNDQP